MDIYDNVLLSYAWTFHADSTPPHMIETEPAGGASDACPDEPVVGWLDEPFPTLPAGALVVRDRGGEVVPGTLEALMREGWGSDRGPNGLQFTPAEPFAAPAEYVAMVGSVTDFCDHPVVPHAWTFVMACLFVDETWDEAIDVVSCDGQQFELSTDKIEGASEYEWQHPKGTRSTAGSR